MYAIAPSVGPHTWVASKPVDHGLCAPITGFGIL